MEHRVFQSLYSYLPTSPAWAHRPFSHAKKSGLKTYSGLVLWRGKTVVHFTTCFMYLWEVLCNRRTGYRTLLEMGTPWLQWYHSAVFIGLRVCLCLCPAFSNDPVIIAPLMHLTTLYISFGMLSICLMGQWGAAGQSSLLHAAFVCLCVFVQSCIFLLTCVIWNFVLMSLFLCWLCLQV